MKKYLLSLTVLVVAAAAMAFTKTGASTNAEAPVKANTTIYQFEGTSTLELRNLDKWKVITEEVDGCISGNLPCYVETDMSISDWLDERNDQEIVQQADGKKF